MAEPLLRIRDLHKSYNDHVVLDGVSFEVSHGEVLGLMGSSGSGKSTILKLIIGLIRPDRGQIWFEDREITCLSEREIALLRPRIGFVFQNGALFDSMTVEENLRYPLERRTQHSEEEIGTIVQERLKRVDLEGTNHLLPSELSGGMIKRAGLARATMLDPPLILFDEPTAGLDPNNVRQFIRTFCHVRRARGLSAVFIAHEASVMLALCDRIAILSEGKLKTIATPGEMKESRDPEVRSFLTTDYVEVARE